MIGTRGVPASYGGFETAVEEIGKRLAAKGHRVTVYGRANRYSLGEYQGMRTVSLPALKRKSLETISNTALATAHAALRNRADAAFIFNAANSPYIRLLRAARIPTALNTDGLEWKRGKWGTIGKMYYRFAEGVG